MKANFFTKFLANIFDLLLFLLFKAEKKVFILLHIKERENQCLDNGGHALLRDRQVFYLVSLCFFSSENKHNFNKYGHGSIDSLGVRYDYGSIMHYGKRDFAKWPWQTTIKTKHGESIGQRQHLSSLDVTQMNLYYKCNEKI